MSERKRKLKKSLFVLTVGSLLTAMFEVSLDLGIMSIILGFALTLSALKYLGVRSKKNKGKTVTLREMLGKIIKKQ